MTVEKLIEMLGEMDPSSQVVFEDQSETKCFSVRDVQDDESGGFVMLLRGTEIGVRVDG